VHGDRGLVPVGDLEGRGGVPGVAVRADHGEDLALTGGGQHGLSVGAGVHDDDFLVVPDDPGVHPGGDHLVNTGCHAILPFLPGARARCLRAGERLSAPFPELRR
jgi:hypothetical protein